MPSGTSRVMPPLVPALQTSLSVQISASLHDVPFSGAGSKTQPLAGLQLSKVQPFESLQTTVPPPTQLPPLHTSAVVHALPSLQLAPFRGVGSNAQPVAGLQVSAVQACESLQTAALPPTQAPALQA